MLIVLSVNEAKNVRMRDAHHSHVRPTSYTTLLHDISHLIDDVHERHRTRSNTSCRTHHGTMRSKEFIRHAGAAASLMNRRCGLRVFHNSSQGIRDIEYKTRRELTVGLAGVNKTRRVGDELTREHHLAHCGKKLIAFLAGFSLGNMPDDPFNDVSPFLKRVTF